MSAAPIGEIGLDWQVAGFGAFSGHPDETDMIMRNVDSGAVEFYNIANNQITSAGSMGQVGTEWHLEVLGVNSSTAVAHILNDYPLS